MIIAFMGNDGSGKTTITKELANIFRDLGYEVIYKHEYQYTILRLLFRIIGMKKLEAERMKMIVEKKKSIKYLLWPFLVWFDICLSLIYFKIYKRKSLVILDRYLLDHYMSFKYLEQLTKLSEWLYLHVPKPDVAFVLWVEPHIAYERKKRTHTYDINFYNEQTSNYLKLSNNLKITTINTNKHIKDNIYDVFKTFPRDKLELILKKGIQNRVLLSVINRYELALNYPSIIKSLQKRITKLNNSFAFIKNFFEKYSITKYVIIKTRYESGWIGNDIDILVSNADFNKIVNILKISNLPNLLLLHKFLDKNKIDIKILGGISIDLHSYIGWGNVVFIHFEDIFNEDYLVKREGGLYFANEKINSIIIILTHIFEKGFITLDEHKFLKKYFDELFMQTNFSYLYTLLSDYISGIRKTLTEKQSRSYPLFIPIHVIIKCYLKLFFYSKNEHSNLLWKLKAFIRDISLMIFWRIRYILKNKLPFEVKFK